MEAGNFEIGGMLTNQLSTMKMKKRKKLQKKFFQASRKRLAKNFKLKSIKEVAFGKLKTITRTMLKRTLIAINIIAGTADATRESKKYGERSITKVLNGFTLST